MKKAKIWIFMYMIIVSVSLLVIAVSVIIVDPFFHYHYPLTEVFYYNLDNERSQNNGITKHFNYEALITGTSMTQNFKTTEFEELFGYEAIKIPYSGARFKEVDDSIEVALENNEEVVMVVRGLDMSTFLFDKDAVRDDLGKKPDYLYDDNLLNDVKYIFNRNVVFDRVCPMIKQAITGREGGICHFDEYNNWMYAYTFGTNSVFNWDSAFFDKDSEKNKSETIIELTADDREIVLGSICQNITELPSKYPDVTFYYFFTPYSANWWEGKVSDGSIYQHVEVERLIIEECLKYENIKLYSFNNMTNITTDLNNYKDYLHYGEWINSLMLHYMRDEVGLLTEDNYEQYLDAELYFYLNFDYSTLRSQEDYENDYYAEAIWREDITGIKPLEVCSSATTSSEVWIEDITDYKYLFFYGKTECGTPRISIYDESGTLLIDYTKDSATLDSVWHDYLINVSDLKGKVRIVFQSDNIASQGHEEMCVYRDVKLF